VWLDTDGLRGGQASHRSSLTGDGGRGRTNARDEQGFARAALLSRLHRAPLQAPLSPTLAVARACITAGRPGLQGRWPNRRPPKPGDVAAPTAGPVPGLPFPAVLAARACAKMRGPPPPANDLTPASAHQRRAIVTTTASRLGHLAHRGGPRPRISTALTGFPRQVTSCEAIRTGLCKNITK
jgi:hypothetical protein